MARRHSGARAPYLRRVVLELPHPRPTSYPFSIPSITNGFDLSFTHPVAIFVGENGSGKSTILELIAHRSGFNAYGGNRNHAISPSQDRPALAEYTKIEWLPKVADGFFLRAESFFNFSSIIDEIARTDSRILSYYGGKSLHDQSHGEAFLSLFNHHFGRPGLYLLDEPEAALSPVRQLALLRIIHDMVSTGKAQFIIATHSPILLSYPGATLFSFTEKGIRPAKYEDTDHYIVTKTFLDNPDRYYKALLTDG